MQPTAKTSGTMVHELLAHTYLAYVAAILFGFILEALIPVPLPYAWLMPAGAIVIFLGTAVVFWTQYSGVLRRSNNKQPHELTAADFRTGPYKYSRMPTQYGLFLMTFGLAMLYESVFMMLATIVTLFVVRFVIIPKEEKHLAHKYGKLYAEYKKAVRF